MTKLLNFLDKILDGAYEMVRALVFPGQGSQFVGMGQDLFDNFKSARNIFNEVDDALGQHLSKLIFLGPIEELTLTENTQPALMATSIATITVLKEQLGLNINDICSFIAGHSLGEYSALTAAGAISLADTAKVLRIRGNAMQTAVKQGGGSMVALIGCEFEEARELTNNASQGDDICQIANDNCPGQIVASGTLPSLERLVTLAEAVGIRAIKLAVSAPFHSQLMLPARQIMQEALENIKIIPPSVPLIANVTADLVSDPVLIKELLVKQVTAIVRWRESIQYLSNHHVGEVLEIGAGKVLTGLGKRIDKNMTGFVIQNSQDIQDFCKHYEHNGV